MTVIVRQIKSSPNTPRTPSPAAMKLRVAHTTKTIPVMRIMDAFKPSLDNTQLRVASVKNAPGFELGSLGIGAAASPEWTSPCTMRKIPMRVRIMLNSIEGWLWAFLPNDLTGVKAGLFPVSTPVSEEDSDANQDDKHGSEVTPVEVEQE